MIKLEDCKASITMLIGFTFYLVRIKIAGGNIDRQIIFGYILMLFSSFCLKKATTYAIDKVSKLTSKQEINENV